MSEKTTKKVWKYCPFSWYDTEDMNAPDLHSEAATEIMDIKRMHRLIILDYLTCLLLFCVIPVVQCFYYHDPLAYYIVEALTFFVWFTFRYIRRRTSFSRQIHLLKKNIPFSEQDYNRYKRIKNWQRIIFIIILVVEFLIPIIFHWL